MNLYDKNKSNQSPSSTSGHPDCLYYGDDELEEEYEEVHHEIDGRIRAEGFIDRSVPADETDRSK